MPRPPHAVTILHVWDAWAKLPKVKQAEVL